MIIFLKMLCTLYGAIIGWHYWKSYGPQNFLWISDIGLFITLAALWFESPSLVSICLVSFLIPELLWNLDFFIALITGYSITGMSGYMFDAHYSLFLRSLSLFHLLLPPFWIGVAIYWGYDSRVIFYAIPMIWIILILTYFYTDPAANINWIFMPQERNWKRISGTTWLIVMLIGYPLLVCVPTHVLAQYFFNPTSYNRS